MTNRAKYQLHSILRTTSPLHITAPGNKRINPENGAMVSSTEKSSIPCAGVQMMDVPVAETAGQMISVPVIPSNNIIGHLRRHAAAIVLDVLFTRGEKVNLQTYTALQCGAVNGKPARGNPTFAHYRETRTNPYIGLFGGGPRMMRRYVEGINSVPVTPDTLFMYARDSHPMVTDAMHTLQRRKKVDNDKDGKSENKTAGAETSKLVFTQAWTFRRNDDLRDLVNMDLASRSVEDFENTMRTRQEAIAADVAAKKDNGDSDRNTTLTFSALEFVIPGTRFPISFELNVDDAQLGLFLLTLDRFCAIDRIGGHGRNGFGKFDLNDVLLVNKEDGTISSNIYNNGRLIRNHESVTKILEAWEKAASTMTAEELDRLLMPPVEDDEETRAAKKALRAEEKAKKAVGPAARPM